MSRPDEHYTNGARGSSSPTGEMSSGMLSGAPRKRPDMKPNRVLLFTIIRPDYPITVRVLLAVCKKFNCVPIKIYIFRKRGVQAMVEFGDLETATYVKTNLDGADIYSGCCTLRIEFAKPETLNVNRNTDDTYNAQLEGNEKTRCSKLSGFVAHKLRI